MIRRDFAALLLKVIERELSERLQQLELQADAVARRDAAIGVLRTVSAPCVSTCIWNCLAQLPNTTACMCAGGGEASG